MDYDLTGLTEDDIRTLDFIIDESLKKGPFICALTETISVIM